MTDEKYLKKLGDKISVMRYQRGWTQQELGEKIGSLDTQIRRIEKGQVNSSINMLRKVARVFGLTVSELVDVG